MGILWDFRGFHGDFMGICWNFSDLAISFGAAGFSHIASAGGSVYQHTRLNRSLLIGIMDTSFYNHRPCPNSDVSSLLSKSRHQKANPRSMLTYPNKYEII